MNPENSQDLINNCISFVKNELLGAKGGHDWFHIERVYRNALLIASKEKVNHLIVALGALLHDIAGSKLHGGDETVGSKKACAFLKGQNLSEDSIEHIVKIIENISFKGRNKTSPFTSKELDVIQDADRLDALGAIGLARAFNYGGFKNRTIYNLEI